ncbi:MAG TPA: papain-like cysteine protease family protein [Puia sp.]|nr:papain-like cysteine protease family protein [Puia sp.]
MPLSTNLIQDIGGSMSVSSGMDSFANNYPVERQKMSNWCWAASTVSLCRYYGEGGPLTQQQFVAAMLNMPICSNPFPNPACNKMFDFGIALSKVGHLYLDPLEGPLSSQDLANALRSGPVGCQMLIPGVGGHAVVAVDARADEAGSLFIRVADPGDGTVIVTPYAQLRNNYRGMNGHWVRSYRTKSISG